jgi:hypothetical protein
MILGTKNPYFWNSNYHIDMKVVAYPPQEKSQTTATKGCAATPHSPISFLKIFGERTEGII